MIVKLHLQKNYYYYYYMLWDIYVLKEGNNLYKSCEKVIKKEFNFQYVLIELHICNVYFSALDVTLASLLLLRFKECIN